MLVSRPACEKRQISVVIAPLSGRVSTTGFPASEQVFVAAEKFPTAAILRSTEAPGKETPAAVGSTTTMSFPAADGAVLVSAILSLLVFAAATTSVTAFERDPSGFCSKTVTLPALTTSVAN